MSPIEVSQTSDELTVTEAAKLLQTDSAYVRLLRSQRKLKGRKVDNIWLLTRESVEAYCVRLNKRRERFTKGTASATAVTPAPGQDAASSPAGDASPLAIHD